MFPRLTSLMLFALSLVGLEAAEAAVRCERTLVANIVALDQPMMFNRLGAQNANGMMFALRRDVVDEHDVPLHKGGAATPGKVSLRPDKRPRPIVLRLAAGECLQVNLQNLLAYQANPNHGMEGEGEEAEGIDDDNVVDDQVADRAVSFQVNGLQAVNSIADISANTGRNGDFQVPVGAVRTYTLYAEREGAFAATSKAVTFGGEGAAGNVANGLFGQVVVVPKGGRTYRNTLTEEEMRLATTGRTPTGQPVIDYQARYPQREPWIREGKAGSPIIAMVDGSEIINSEVDAIVMGSNPDGSFPASTYPLESIGKRNPAMPNRLDAFRDFSAQFTDETAVTQAFPGYWNDPVMGHVLEPARDSFMINYGAGGMGAEVLANRLGVGPMHDCLSCAYEEFFLSSHTVGDVAMLVDVPANVGLENIRPGEVPRREDTGVKATMALFPGEPANVNHSYIGDLVKFRNTHNGHEQHIFHLHGHQWLFNPNDDNSDYVDAQAIGPGAGYTYEIANGGSGNRNRVAGDAIYHCHFYPHFAQGMWHMWRVHDVFESGTRLEVSQQGADGYHTEPFALRNGKPVPGARALPDGEIVAGTPIPAIVPLPGKAMAPMPGLVTVVPKLAPAVAGHDDDDDEDDDDDDAGHEAGSQAIGSVALVDRSEANRNADGSLKNPGYPFWIGGIETSVGQRPPTPPLDMLDKDSARRLRDSGKALWANLDPEQSGGWDGGLPRHALDGVAAGGEAHTTTTALDFSKEIVRAKPLYIPEEGNDVEQAAMAYHAKLDHPSYAQIPGGAPVTASFRTNGALPVAGAPYYEPCMDDRAKRLTSTAGTGYFNSATGQTFTGSSPFTADKPRLYKGANIQFDAVYNKVGYHFPQARIIALWEDAWPVITKQRAPEPLVMRMNTFDCVMYQHTNLIPSFYEMDDYQVRTPTDVIGQHIHLPKWDLTAADGSANGWNYEDGILSPGTVVERIHAIRSFNGCTDGDARDGTADCPKAKTHPFFGRYGRNDWLGARTQMQRWFVDPVINVQGIDRGLGTIFTHDHLGPSTHQQLGLYATVLAEPAGSTWYHAETGDLLYNTALRQDGGPTSWQAVIATGDLDNDGKNDSYREFFLEYSDFAHAYEAGVYVGAGPDGKPNAAAYPATADTFRYAINPPLRKEAATLLEQVIEARGGILPGCPSRPCPQAISVDDPGMFVVNYRNEPVALRVYDPNKVGPDGKRGMQADGMAGDLAYALQSRTDRAIPAMNLAPNLVTQATGPTGGVTQLPPHINKAGAEPGDPFTPMLRTYSGDNVRIRIHAGGHEEEHNVTIHGVKWLQNGSGFGSSSNSGWKASQMIGISEQLGFMAPVSMISSSAATTGDYLYSMDASLEGYWSGLWGVMRNYTAARTDLFPVPNNPKPMGARNTVAFDGICPRYGANPNGIGTRPTPVRNYEIVAALANDILINRLNLSINDPANPGQHVGGPLKADGGTLVLNSRPVDIPQVSVTDPEDGETLIIGGHRAPLHDPTAVLYVRKADLDPVTGKLKAGVPVEPIVLRAAAGDCINITLENRLPLVMPDLANTSVMQGIVKRDRSHGEGSSTFSNNLMRPSSHVGVHAQLLAYDITKSDGMNVGINPVQTVPPRAGTSGAWPSKAYQFYAGHLEREGKPVTQLGRSVDNINTTAIEFGGLNLTPADPIKQPQKGLGGAMSILPVGATWTEDTRSRASATVTAPGQTTYRDFVTVWQKALNTRWADGAPVEGIAAEGNGVPTDPQDNSNMALNYKTEPLWLRFGLAPDAPFGHADGRGWGDVANAHMAYSNALVGGDPQTPVLYAKPGQPTRMHILLPGGGSRGTTFQLDGHLWPLHNFQAEKSDAGGYPMGAPGIGSVRFAPNPMAMYIGAQESVLPAAHFSFMLPSAGGANGVPGDYLFRDYAAYGNASGLWGILRVTNEPEPTTPPAQ